MSNQLLEFQEILTHWMASILPQLSADPIAVSKIKGGAKLLIEGISVAMPHFCEEPDNFKKCCQDLLRLVKLAEQWEGEGPNPFLGQIKQRLLTSLTKAASLEAPIPSPPLAATAPDEVANCTSLVMPKPVIENQGAVTLPEPVIAEESESKKSAENDSSSPLPLVPVSSPKIKTATADKKTKDKSKKSEPVWSRSQRSEEEYRNYCWELATYSDSYSKKLKDKIKNWDQAPSNLPRPGDVVIHGTLFNGGEEFPPVWIGPSKGIAGFAEFMTQVLPQFSSDGHIWLSFAELSDDYTAYYFEPKVANEFAMTIPPWCMNHEGTLAFWCRCLDLLGWAWLAPDADFFVHPQHETLSQNREAICNTLWELHARFQSELTKPAAPESYYLAKELHKVYATFYRFLFPEDLQITQSRVDQPFSRLQQAASEEIKVWQQLLQIEELQRAGVLTDPVSYRDIKDQTDNSSRIASDSPFLQGVGRSIEKSQVLYWLQPVWKLNGFPSDSRFSRELKGSVLYCN